jgi:2-phospho-L-lactate guanylyltransferase
VRSSGGVEVRRWAVVVPVKRLVHAKSRLATLGDEVRQALALAFAEDVVLAATSCPAVGTVVVVTDDAAAGRAASRLGARVTPDLPGGGIDAALEHGAAVAGRPGAGVAAVAADLPALTASALAAVLSRVRVRGVVSDAAATGTTLLAAAAGQPLSPSYGPGSLARHLAGGAELLDAPAVVRRDVDTPADLREALELGVGPSTAGVVAQLGLLPAPEASACSSFRGTMHG